jgi:hypothetical protein
MEEHQMTKLNLALTALLLVGIIVPGIALASGTVTDMFFGGILLKVMVAISLFLLLNNMIAHLAHTRR